MKLRNLKFIETKLLFQRSTNLYEHTNYYFFYYSPFTRLPIFTDYCLPFFTDYRLPFTDYRFFSGISKIFITK